MRRTSKCSRFQNPERGLFSLPRPSHSSPSLQPGIVIYSNNPPILPFPPPLHPTEPPLFLRFFLILFIFDHADGRQRQSWPFAIASPYDAVPYRIPHLPDRQRTSSRHTCWPRRCYHRCCQWDRSCCLTRVGQVNILSSSIIHFLHLPFHPTPASFSSYTHFPGSRFLFSNVPGLGRSMHVMRCAPRDHMGCPMSSLVCGRLSHPTLSWVSPSISTVPHPILSGTELTRDRWSFVRLGLKVAIADINAAALETLAKELVAAHGETNVLAMLTDVSKLEDVVRLRERVYEAWGEVSVVRRGLPSPPYLPSPFPSPSPSTFCD
jgi:hypothetical protein